MPETNHYDVKCPICGTVNRHLFLEETDGWMICEKCEEQVRVPGFEKTTAIPGDSDTICCQ